MTDSTPIFNVIIDAKGVTLEKIVPGRPGDRKASKGVILRQRDAIECYQKLKAAGDSFHGTHSFQFLDTAKTRKSRRTLPLAAPHVVTLKAHSAEQSEKRLALGGDFNPSEFVFTTTSGTPIDAANDRKQWLRLLKAAGVRKMRVHSQRHTAATLMLAAGSGVQQVQKTLGHTSIRTTVDIYGHLTAEDSAPITEAITRALTA